MLPKQFAQSVAMVRMPACPKGGEVNHAVLLKTKDHIHAILEDFGDRVCATQECDPTRPRAWLGATNTTVAPSYVLHGVGSIAILI